jgi:hypothetical protein
MTIEESETAQYDIFVSYSHDDSKEIVNKLVEELVALDLNVWYDQEMMSLGDSIAEAMEDGLSKSDFGLAVLSETYFEGASRFELNGLIKRHTSEEEVIVPILYGISHTEVTKINPSLGDIYAEEISSENIQEVAVSIYHRIQSQKQSDNEAGGDSSGEESADRESLPSFTSVNVRYEDHIPVEKGQKLTIKSWRNHHAPSLDELEASEIEDMDGVKYRSRNAGTMMTVKNMEHPLTGIVTEIKSMRSSQTKFTMRIDESQLEGLPDERGGYETF